MGEDTAPLGEWLCALDGRGLRMTRSEAPGLFGGAHVLVFDLGGGVPLRLSMREAENARRVRGLAAAAAGDGIAERPVSLAAWIAAARDPAALAGLGGALRQVSGRLAEVDRVAPVRAEGGRSGPRPGVAAPTPAQGPPDVSGRLADVPDTLAAECGAKLRVPFAMARGGTRGAAGLPEAAAPGRRVWIWGAGEVASPEQWRRKAEVQVLAPLRVASALAASAPQPGAAERAYFELLSRLHRPDGGRPLLSLSVGEIHPAAP